MDGFSNKYIGCCNNAEGNDGFLVFIEFITNLDTREVNLTNVLW